MKTKIISFFLVLVLLSIYPAWRYFTNAKLFADAIFGHASNMGNWTYGTVSSGLGGNITIRNIAFTPNNHTQGFDIGSVVIKTEPMFLLKSNPSELAYLLPETLSLSVNSASLNHKSSDILDSLKQNSMWMILVGHAGSFGCSRDQYVTFDDTVWNKIIKNNQIYNVDLFFSKQEDGSLDADLILDAENLFSSTWSSNLKSSYNENQIVIDELLTDKLYYSYLDNGFNLARNNACIENYKSSFAAYRLSSAEHVQQFMRVNYSKEFPTSLINWYQRVLAPETDFNAIISIKDRMYLSDIAQINQLELYENSSVEVSSSNNEYLPVNLKEIDYTKIDTESLMSENIKKQEKADLEAQILKDKNAEQQKTTVITTGARTNKRVQLRNLNSVINKRVRIKTIRGRPIKGILRDSQNGMVTLDSHFRFGTSTISISIDMISSVELL